MTSDRDASPLQHTPVENIPGIVKELKATFMSRRTREVEFRRRQLTLLGFMIEENQERIAEAIGKDTGCSRHEAFLNQIWALKEDIQNHIKNLSSWAKPEYVPTSWIYWLTSPTIYREPKGTVLIIGAWNYPWSLTLGPLAGAVAAGCTAIIKPSELSEHSSALMEELCGQYLDNTCYRLINGGVKETTALLDLQFDHIFYTGNGTVAKIVSQKAAIHLTPLTLELGGKSPVCILPDADVKLAAKRLLWGKSLNAGQTCIAPDYLLVPSSIQADFISACKDILREWYPEGSGNAVTDSNHPKIINTRHWKRIVEICDNTKGELVVGDRGEKGQDEGKETIGFRIYKDVEADDTLMSQELFGPVMGMVTKDTMDDMIDFINERDHALALYVFTKDKKNVNYIRERTRSGQILQNDTLFQYVVPGLPFGGVGPSGSGNYHGRRTFDTFTYERTYANIPSWYEFLLGARYRPFNVSKFNQMAMLFPTFKGKRPPLENTKENVE